MYTVDTYAHIAAQRLRIDGDDRHILDVHIDVVLAGLALIVVHRRRVAGLVLGRLQQCGKGRLRRLRRWLLVLVLAVLGRQTGRIDQQRQQQRQQRSVGEHCDDGDAANATRGSMNREVESS